MTKVHTKSEAFQAYLSLMRFLKRTPLEMLAPKICISCWTIYTRENEIYHADQVIHKVTSEFTNMA
jgi:hypothetical protein